MRRLILNRTLLTGIAGMIFGATAQGIINGISGRAVIKDGMMWGAVFGVLAASLPGLVEMGALTVKSKHPPVNLLVGLVLFVLISLAVVLVFYAMFFVLGELLTFAPPRLSAV
jgi:hypothetical protein